MSRAPVLLKMVVSIEPPYQILATETGVDEILLHSAEDLRRQTIDVFEGPRTDRSLFRIAIQKTAVRESSKYQLILYDRYGQSHNNSVTFSPYHDATGTKLACMMAIEESDPILLQDVFKDNVYAQALVSAEAPYHLQMINDEFSSIFRFAREDISGQTMNIIQSHKTDILRWCTLFQTACEGQAVTGTLVLASRWQVDVRALLTFAPVVDAPNSKVTYVLIRFEPSSCEEVTARPQLPAAAQHPQQDLLHPTRSYESSADPGSSSQGPGSHAPISHGPFWEQPASSASKHLGPAAAAACLADASLQPPAGRRDKRPLHCPKIYPRRKAHEPKTDTPSTPVVITPELLDSLADIPLYRAAEKIGVSATALKLACRKLGVRKWQCRKRSSAGGDGPGSESDAGRGASPAELGAPEKARRRAPPPPALLGPHVSAAAADAAICSPSRSTAAAIHGCAGLPWLAPGAPSPSAPGPGPYAAFAAAAAAAAGAAEAQWAAAGAVEQPDLDVPTDLNRGEAPSTLLPFTPRRAWCRPGGVADGDVDPGGYGLLGDEPAGGYGVGGGGFTPSAAFDGGFGWAYPAAEPDPLRPARAGAGIRAEHGYL
jgi:hypothetical protein